MASKAAPAASATPPQTTPPAQAAQTAQAAPPPRTSRVRGDYPKFRSLHWAMLNVLESAPPNGHAYTTIQTRIEQTLRRRRELEDGQTVPLGDIYEDLLDGAIAYAECCDHEGVKQVKGTRVRLTAAGQQAVARYRQDPAAAKAEFAPEDDDEGDESELQTNPDGTLRRRGE